MIAEPIAIVERADQPPIAACMGGWCTQRQACQHYHAADRAEPLERMCPAGKDYPLFSREPQ